MANVRCPCRTTILSKKDSLLEEFGSLRKKCPALNSIFIPEEIWPDFQKTASAVPNIVKHRSIVLGAFKNGFLSKITLPVHRYLLKGQEPKANLTNQYRKDLIEKWMLENDLLARHQKSRIFQGKLAEIMIAAWLEDKGWLIDNLEALSGKFDIEATSPKQISYTIEVKYIGHEDDMFEGIVESLRSGTVVDGSWKNGYDGCNFILFKAFEAAKQLSASTKNPLAILVVSNMAWDLLEIQIKDQWIFNRPLRFFDSASKKWKFFLRKKKSENKFANIENELDTIIGDLQELWVMKEQNCLAYSLESKIEFKSKS